MRYYELSVIQPISVRLPTPITDNAPIPTPNKPQFFASSQFPNGTYDPSALDIDFDLLIAPYNIPVGAQTITVWGIGLQGISEAQQYTGAKLTLKAGMQNGLPLSNPKQAGTIVEGYVFQSFGDWQGTDMYLNFTILPSPYTYETPSNLVLKCNKGGDFVLAVQNALESAYPDMKVNVNVGVTINPVRALNAFYSTLERFAADVANLSAAFSSGQYQVLITIQKGAIQVYYAPLTNQNTLASPLTSTPIQLNFTDFVGQPAWIRPNVIQLPCVMRSDIIIGSLVRMPVGFQNLPGLVQTTAQSLPSSLKYKSAFSGVFIINKLRSIGHYRNHDANAWVTILEAAVYGQ